MIEVRGLSKRYGDKVAVNNLSFSVAPGKVTGFLGPNGAGKTTTMRLILGLDYPDAGTVTIEGKRYASLANPMREVGALIDAKAVHGGRSAYNHLLCLAQTNNLPKRRVGEVLELVGLTEVARKRTKGFSLGMSQRLGIAATLLGDPALLMFDEPVNGLDPEGILWIRNLMKALAAEGRTVFVSSHLMSEMENTADHLIVIGRGKLISDCTTAAFIAANSQQSVRVRTPQPDELIALASAAGATVRDDAGDSLVLHGLTAAQVGGALGRQPAGRAGFAGTVRSEFTKIRSVRSTYWTLLALVLACVGIGALFSWGQTERLLRIESGRRFSGGQIPPGFATHIANEIRSQAASISLFGLLIGQLIIIVLGALAITSEYSTGMIRTSLAVMPRRGTVFAAKGVVFGLVALVTGLVTSFLAFFAGQAILSSQHVSTTLGHPDVLRTVVGGGLFLAVCGLLSFGIGAMLRHTAGAIAAGIGLMFVLWILSQFLPGPPSGWFGQADIDKWIPFNAGSAIWENQANGLNPFSPWIGFAVFCAYAAAALAAGLVVFLRRDA